MNLKAENQNHSLQGQGQISASNPTYLGTFQPHTIVRGMQQWLTTVWCVVL